MKESDWKVFKKIKAQALDQFCCNALVAFADTIGDEDQSAHNRYLQLYTDVERTNRNMALMFDGHSRSKAWAQLMGMRDAGITDEKLVAELSQEFQNQTKPS